MKYKKLAVLVSALAVAMALSGCGGSNESAPAETISPEPSAEATVVPTTTPGSVNEKDENTGDMTDPDNSVDAGNGSTSESRQENKGDPDSAGENNGSAQGNTGSAQGNTGSTQGNTGSAQGNTGSAQEDMDSAMDDMKRAGEDLGNAAQNAGNSVEDSMKMQ